MSEITKVMSHYPIVADLLWHTQEIFLRTKNIHLEQVIWCITIKHCLKLLGITSKIRCGSKLFGNSCSNCSMWLEIPIPDSNLILDPTSATMHIYGIKYTEITADFTTESTVYHLMAREDAIISNILSYGTKKCLPYIALSTYITFPYFKEIISFVESKCVKSRYQEFVAKRLAKDPQEFPDVYIKNLHELIRVQLLKHNLGFSSEFACGIMFNILKKLNYPVELAKRELSFEGHTIKYTRETDAKYTLRYVLVISNTFIVDFMDGTYFMNFIIRRFKTKSKIEIVDVGNHIPLDKIIPHNFCKIKANQFIIATAVAMAIIQKRIAADLEPENILESSSIMKFLDK